MDSAIKCQPVEYDLFVKSCIVLCFLLICRVVAMYFIPLNDTTEARYGEIARIMLETGNWVTPMQTYGVPFWAKPPLSSWLSAFSMKLLGVNEFAVRLPSLLLSIGTLWLVQDVIKKRCGSQVAMIATLVLAGSLFFFLDAGTMMTDPSLLFCTTLSLIAFWNALAQKNKAWGYVFFGGLGFGLLAKGPVAIVLTGMPVFFWVLRHKQRWTALWKQLPWITGTLLMLLIAGPWYVLAEIHTPGFINYFIIGENFHRFIDSGWAGDKYGFAHSARLGMIWIYAFLGIFPWSIVGFFWLLRHAKTIPALCRDKDGWMSYLLLCTLVPLAFFTFSSNIIYPYVFPSLPFFALVFAELVNRSHLNVTGLNKLIGYAAISGMLFLIGTALFVFIPEWIAKSQSHVVSAYKKQMPSPNARLVYWALKTDFSAQFYSEGKAIATDDLQQLRHLLLNQSGNFLVVSTEQLMVLPVDLKEHLIEVATIPRLKDNLILLRSNKP